MACQLFMAALIEKGLTVFGKPFFIGWGWLAVVWSH
jgi:hypothetical protein